MRQSSKTERDPDGQINNMKAEKPEKKKRKQDKNKKTQTASCVDDLSENLNFCMQKMEPTEGINIG